MLSFIFIFINIFAHFSHAQTLNVRATHPMALQHQLPSGEAPGWKSDSWVQIDVTTGNHWSEPTKYKDNRNNNTLIWDSDFEQTTTWLEMGKAMNKHLALSVEAPYVTRYEGSTSDELIDGYHHALGFSRFGRDRHDVGRVVNSSTVIESGSGVRTTRTSKDTGLGNVKFKLKYWMVKWPRDTGVGISVHTKVPVDQRTQGLTSGSVDYSGLLHFAIPVGEKSAVYITSGATYVPRNWMFEKWPRHKIIWLMDYHLDLSLAEKWALVFNFSLQGPFMKKNDLTYDSNVATRPGNEDYYERSASNYNALVNPRGHQILGLKRQFHEVHSWMFYVQEDWGMGDKNNSGDMVYSQNQPDFALGLKVNFNL